mmetsp:Transcript_20929/g.48361  ORF Transcript_20929/g.48361 Transcript_20929/m.48361 type:complete len:150 (+) Transcript_20929:110-559(+)
MGLLGSTEAEVHANLGQEEAGAAGGSTYNPQPPPYPPPPMSSVYQYFPAPDTTEDSAGVHQGETSSSVVQASYASTPLAIEPTPTAPAMQTPVMVTATPVFPAGSRWSSGLFTGLCGECLVFCKHTKHKVQRLEVSDRETVSEASGEGN